MMKEPSMRVSLFGKHPSSSEYLYLGESSSFTNSIVSWIKAGYEALLKNRQKYLLDIVQHFYFLNKETDSFVCATLKLSKDSKGREYPLIILVEVAVSKEMRDFQAIWSKNLEIFQNIYSLEELENLLKKYTIDSSHEKNFKNIDRDILAAFVSEDFLKSKLFYKPLQIDDFIEMMR
ncbi:MAG: type VI secretion system-associated protein TagF [Epsilonproteobacteria bacterium]|nr:MAG: type VI secretion system-associated protein TagF [Campylobacterota bacterium]